MKSIILSDPGSEVEHIEQQENCDQDFLYWKGID